MQQDRHLRRKLSDNLQRILARIYYALKNISKSRFKLRCFLHYNCASPSVRDRYFLANITIHYGSNSCLSTSLDNKTYNQTLLALNGLVPIHTGRESTLSLLYSFVSFPSYVNPFTTFGLVNTLCFEMGFAYAKHV